MRKQLTLKDVMLIRLGAIGWFVLVLLFLLSIPIISAITNWLFVLSILFGTIVAIPIYLFIAKFRDHSGKSIFVKTSIAFSMSAIVLIAAPIFYFAYETEADPLVLPLVTLSNGKKHVIYQGMVHVGSEAFYKSVVYDLENALANGYDLFYEGVQSSDEDANEWFSDVLSGGADLSQSYEALANVCGVKFQLNYFSLLAKQQEKNPQRHITADVTTRQMLDEWERLTNKEPELKDRLEASKSSFDSSGYISWLEKQNEERKRIGGVLCRAILTMALSNPNMENVLSPIILDFRNKNLADFIVKHSHDSIYVTYGAAHLPGLIRELTARDSSWRVESVKWSRALAPDHHYLGDRSRFIPE